MAERGQRSSSGERRRGSGGSVSQPQPSIDQLGVLRIAEVSPGYSELVPTKCEGTKFKVSLLQHMGDRKTQEDRYLIVPDAGQGCALFGVFDGTVGDFASDNVKDIVLPKLLEDKNFPGNIPEALRSTFVNSDQELLNRCSRSASQQTGPHQLHYSTSTGVMAVVTQDSLVVGHLGDSRIVAGIRQSDGRIIGKQLTEDHKPDQDHERKRIEECGGMVERLINHNNKPFIRGGDFMMRKALGEQPMQLQYSRAFGGKDLKIFGLSSRPDISKIPIANVSCVILASDGLWDVINAEQAVDIVNSAVAQSLNPSAALVRASLLEQSKRKARADNITAVVVLMD